MCKLSQRVNKTFELTHVSSLLPPNPAPIGHGAVTAVPRWIVAKATAPGPELWNLDLEVYARFYIKATFLSKFSELLSIIVAVRNANHQVCSSWLKIDFPWSILTILTPYISWSYLLI